MDFQLTFLVFCIVIVLGTAVPSDIEGIREKRDVMDSVKNAKDEAGKTLTDASDAVVQVFKPTEKSTLDKMADSVKSIGQ